MTITRCSGAVRATLGALLFLGAASAPFVTRAQDAPKYQVDASWPKQLPNNWIMGQVGGMTVDSHDHIWVLQRPRSLTADETGAAQTPPRSECCLAAPSVLEFAFIHLGRSPL